MSFFGMNKSIISLCQEWQAYQLPQWKGRDEGTDYAKATKKILGLIEELATVRAYLRVIDQERTKLTKRALRWTSDGDPSTPEFAWDCYFHNRSFSRDDSAQIIKTLKTFFYKETVNMKNVSRASDSYLLRKIIELPAGGIVNWKLVLGFRDDLIDLLKAIKSCMERALDSADDYRVVQQIFEDLKLIVPAQAGAASPGGAAPSPAALLTDLVTTPCAKMLQTYMNLKFDRDGALILEKIRNHYRHIEMNLTDYMANGGPPADDHGNRRALIKQLITAYHAMYQDWCDQFYRAGSFPAEGGGTPSPPDLVPSFTAGPPQPGNDLDDRIKSEIKLCHDKIINQIKTLQRIRKISYNDQIINNIFSQDRDHWNVVAN